MYKKVDTSLNFLEREKEVLEFWKENDIFNKNIELNDGNNEFTFYDGPPTANGKPHIGHILTRVIKDIIPRYRVMKGEHCLRKAGWDTHGLPVELEVEKLLGIDGKQEIEKYGIEPFIKKCGLDTRKKVNSITKEERMLIVNTLKRFTVPISGFRPIEEAIITSGGVNVKEISPKTMESKIVPGIYFAGEIIDVDAYTGGYNLQIAFSTGYLAGLNA